MDALWNEAKGEEPRLSTPAETEAGHRR